MNGSKKNFKDLCCSATCFAAGLLCDFWKSSCVSAPTHPKLRKLPSYSSPHAILWISPLPLPQRTFSFSLTFLVLIWLLEIQMQESSWKPEQNLHRSGLQISNCPIQMFVLLSNLSSPARISYLFLFWARSSGAQSLLLVGLGDQRSNSGQPSAR